MFRHHRCTLGDSTANLGELASLICRDALCPELEEVGANLDLGAQSQDFAEMLKLQTISSWRLHYSL